MINKATNVIINNEQLMAEWDKGKNDSLHIYPETTALHCNRKVWWKCNNGHSWEMSPDKRLKAKGCPYCSNKRVLIGYNDLSTLFPHLAKEWNFSKNEVDINSIVIGSAKRINWICSKCKHEWICPLRGRTQRGTGCPECAKKEIPAKRLQTIVAKAGAITDPLLLKEWNYGKNEKEGLFPDKLPPKSNKRAWWKCSTCGYEWQAVIADRTEGSRCPLCINRVVVPGINDLATTHPQLAAEWDYEANGKLTPHNVTYGKGSKVGWICPLGHKYKATILHRSGGTNCPICNAGRQTSFAEQAVFYYVKKIFPNAVNRYREIFDNGMELDIYIPEIKYGIEYDGSFWHKRESKETNRKEATKYSICQSNNIKLIRIKAVEEIPSVTAQYFADYTLFYKEDDLQELEKLIQSLYFKLCNSTIHPLKKWKDAIGTVNIKRDRFEISKYLSKIKNSFADKYPEIAKEWHPTKNKGLSPNVFNCGSSFLAWWLCPVCGHEWETSIYHRANGTGCEKCSQKKHSGGSHYKARKIYQYTKEGIFIQEWQSVSEASRELKINNSNIFMCANGKRAVAGGYWWSFEYCDKELAK